LAQFLAIYTNSSHSTADIACCCIIYWKETLSFRTFNTLYTYIHTYHSRFIPEGVAEVPQIFLRDTHVLPKLVSYEKLRDRW
jgi:hypothetical protein